MSEPPRSLFLPLRLCPISRNLLVLLIHSKLPQVARVQFSVTKCCVLPGPLRLVKLPLRETLQHNDSEPG